MFVDEAVTLSGVAKASLYRDVKVMLHLQVTKTTMELLPLVFVSLLTWSGTTFADENGKKTNHFH